MADAWNRLVPKLYELDDLASAVKLMYWDQAVNLPPRAAADRARAMATLEAIAHARLTDPELGELLSELEGDGSLDEPQAASIRIARRDYDKATKVPHELVRALAEATGLAYQAWTEARAASDFELLRPHLEKVVSLKKQEADAYGWQQERYDALLDLFEPDMTSAEVEALFTELTEKLRPVAETILSAAEGTDPDTFRGKKFDTSQQIAFSEWLIDKLGYDSERGRLDSSPHPFTMQISANDVRQTTRANEDDFPFSVYATIHETGHALYEQGFPEDFVALPVGRVPSLGLHESQSRLWENQVGRSRPFIELMLPRLKETFPSELGTVAPDEFYRAVNHPERSLIRVSADEVTYNLHVTLRFEIELALFRDELDVADVAEAWNAGMEKHLGIRPDDDADGVLQDMHWSIGSLGYFPTYTLGTLYAAALYDRAVDELGGVDSDLRAGDVSRLLGWLRDKIHRHAYLKPAKELAAEVLGGPLSTDPFVDHLKNKYADLYGLTF